MLAAGYLAWYIHRRGVSLFSDEPGAVVLRQFHGAAWYVVGALALLFVAFETRGRTLEDIHSALAWPATVKVAAQ